MTVGPTGIPLRDSAKEAISSEISVVVLLAVTIVVAILVYLLALAVL